MPRIFDNLTEPTQLKTGLNEMFQSFEAIDVATGYFDLRGWSQLDDLIKIKAATRKPGDRPVARILLGMVRPGEHEELMRNITQPLDNDTDGEGARGRAKRIREELASHLASPLSHGIPAVADRSGSRTATAGDHKLEKVRDPGFPVFGVGWSRSVRWENHP